MEARSLIFSFLMSDLKSVLVILFWVDLTVTCLLVSYVFHLNDERNRKVLLRYTGARAVQTAAWALFILISPNPGLESMVIGSAALFGGFYLETRSLFSLTVSPRRSTQTILDILAAASIVSLLGSYAFFGRNEERIIYFGLIACLVILLPGPVSMLRKRKSPLQAAIALGYGMLVSCIIVGVFQMSFPRLPKLIPPLLIGDLVKILFVEVTMIGGMGTILITKQEADRRIMELAFRDPLTGLHNRRYFMEEARGVMGDAARDKRVISMVFLDIDHFKKINDEFGHHFGDMVLRDFSAILKMNIRPLDRSCRYGGEEFLLLLDGTEPQAGIAAVGRVFERVRASRFNLHPRFSYTVSAGLYSCLPKSNSVDELQRIIDRADSALYRAKGSGRDRIEAESDANGL